MEKRKKKTATLLALFLGGIGIHKFYIGEIGKSILFFIFCFTYIPLFLGILDFFKFIGMTEDEFDKLYNKEIYATEQTILNKNRIEKTFNENVNLYGEEIAIKIQSNIIWLDMLPEHLILIKGNPTKIETHNTKKFTKEIYIYGNKTSGDVFTFKDNKLIEFKDR